MKKAKMAAIVASSAMIAALGLFGCSSGGGESSEPAAEPSADQAAEAAEGEAAGQEGQEAGEGIVPVDGTVEQPAQVGEWLRTTVYSTEDDADHIIYYRFTGVDDDPSSIQAAIDAYNNSDSIYYIDELDAEDADDMEYVMASYEIYIPEDVPLGEYGTSAPPYLYFSLYGTDGGSIEANGYVYIGLIGEDITVEAPDSLFPGDSMTGVFLFAAPQNVSEFLIQGDYNDLETDETIETNTLVKR